MNETPTPFADAVAGYILGIVRPARAVVPLTLSRLDDELLDHLRYWEARQNQFSDQARLMLLAALPGAGEG